MPSVGEWLASLGLSEYADRFAEHRIDFSILRDLTDKNLKEELGIVLLGDRRRLLRAIAKLAGTASATPQLAAGSETNRRDEAERRPLTGRVFGLVGATALSGGLAPEDSGAVCAASHPTGARIPRTYDGFLAEFGGDGILAYFGYPLAHEDDAERAVRASLDITAAVGRLETRAAEPLAVRIGI